MFGLRKVKYEVRFVRKEQETYRVLRKKRVAPSVNLVSYSKKRIHLIDLSHPSFSVGSKYVYLVDIESEKEYKETDKKGNEHVYYGGQLRFWGSNLKYPSGMLSFITIENGIRQLSSSLEAKPFNLYTIILLILGISAGIFAGLFIGGLF